MDNAITCSKCDGRGKIEGFGHIDNGKCFQCGGAGTVDAGRKSSRRVVNTLVYNGAIVTRALIDGLQGRAEFYAERVAADLHKHGTATALEVLNTLRKGDFWDDTLDCRVVNPDAGLAASQLIIAKGRISA